MKLISREQIKRKLKRKEEIVDVPEFGEGMQVRVVGFDVSEKSEFEEQFVGKSKAVKLRSKTYRERLILATVRDENDNPLLKSEDIKEISEQDSFVMERIVDAAMRVTGMAPVEKKED